MAKKKTGRPARVFTDAERTHVTRLLALGTDQRVIAKMVNCDDNTLRKHFRDEIKESRAIVNAQIGCGVVARALKGDNAASFFWLKTHGGPEWRETARIEHTGKDGGPIKLSVEARAAKIRQLLDLAAKRKEEALMITGLNDQPS